MRANKPAAPNPAIASRLHAKHHWRGVGEPERSAASRNRFDTLRLGVLAPLRLDTVDFNAETQRRGGGGKIRPGARPPAVPTAERGSGRSENILCDKPWIAEPDHCCQDREAVRVCREVTGWLESSARRG